MCLKSVSTIDKFLGLFGAGRVFKVSWSRRSFRFALISRLKVINGEVFKAAKITHYNFLFLRLSHLIRWCNVSPESSSHDVIPWEFMLCRVLQSAGIFNRFLHQVLRPKLASITDSGGFGEHSTAVFCSQSFMANRTPATIAGMYLSTLISARFSSVFGFSLFAFFSRKC